MKRSGYKDYLQMVKAILFVLGPVLAVWAVNNQDQYGWWAVSLGAVLLIYSLRETFRS